MPRAGAGKAAKGFGRSHGVRPDGELRFGQALASRGRGEGLVQTQAGAGKLQPQQQY